MPVPWDDLVGEVKARTDILEVVSDYVKMRSAGNSHVGLCPFHSENSPSFRVTPEKGFWHCFGCGEGGDVFKFLQKIDNVSFKEALERLAQRAGIALPERGERSEAASERERLRHIHELACRFYEKALSQTPAAQAYLNERGMAPEFVTRFRLGFAPDSWESLRQYLRRERATDDELVKAGLLKRRSGEETGGYDAFRNRLIFPIADLEGKVIAFGGRLLESVEGQPKYLNSPETPLFHKSRILYGLHRALNPIKERREALVMEGYMDVIAAHEYGFTHAVAPLGTALTESHLQLLKRHCDRVLLVFDADSAGMKAALRSLALFETSEIEARVVVLPAGEDPDSLLRKHGAAPFAQALEKARPILDYRIEAVLSQHDVQTDEGFNAAMREIAPLLSQTFSPDRWIHRLAEIRSAGAAERVAFYEEDIRNRLRRTRNGESAPPTTSRSSPPTAKPEGSPADAAPVSSSMKRLYKVEELILRACLDNRAAAGELLGEIGPERFLRPETQELATLISAHLSNGEWNPGQWSFTSEGMQSLMGRLITDPTPIPELPAMRQVTGQIREYWRQQEIKALLEGRTPSPEELRRINQLYLQE